MQLCPLCMNPFGECSEIMHACANLHEYHPQCLLRWFQTNPEEELRCPNCRVPSHEWHSVKLIKPAGGEKKIVVRDDYNMAQLKKMVGWRLCIPNNCIILLTQTPTGDLLFMPDHAPIMDNPTFHMVLRGMHVQYTILLDIPRRATADVQYQCPLSKGLLLNPMRAADGVLYEQFAIEHWVATRGDVSPISRHASLLPLVPHTDPAFLAAVHAIHPDPVPQEKPHDTQITVRIVTPMTTEMEGVPVTVRLGDSFAEVARRIHPRANRIVTSNGCIYSTALYVTLATGRVEEGDRLYVS